MKLIIYMQSKTWTISFLKESELHPQDAYRSLKLDETFRRRSEQSTLICDKWALNTGPCMDMSGVYTFTACCVLLPTTRRLEL